MGFLYIIQSKINDAYYIGSSTDFEKRLIQHNRGLNISTRKRGSWELVFVQKFETLKKARQVEYKLKNKKSKVIIEKIVKDQEIKFLRE